MWTISAALALMAQVTSQRTLISCVFLCSIWTGKGSRCFKFRFYNELLLPVPSAAWHLLKARQIKTGEKNNWIFAFLAPTLPSYSSYLFNTSYLPDIIFLAHITGEVDAVKNKKLIKYTYRFRAWIWDHQENCLFAIAVCFMSFNYCPHLHLFTMEAQMMHRKILSSVIIF